MLNTQMYTAIRPQGQAPFPENERAACLDRDADALLFLGRTAAAERLSHLAEAIRHGLAR